MAMWFLGRMNKPFKTWHVDQIMLLPPSVQDLVPEGHLAHHFLKLANALA
jgi:hypothetical protein